MVCIVILHAFYGQASIPLSGLILFPFGRFGTNILKLLNIFIKVKEKKY